MRSPENYEENEYYEHMLPPKISRPIYIWDILSMIIAVAMLILFLPWNISEGIVQAPGKYGSYRISSNPAEEGVKLPEIPEGCFETFFRTGTLQSGGYVQKTSKGNHFLYYENGSYESFEEDWEDTEETGEGNNGWTDLDNVYCQGIFFANVFLSVPDDDFFFYKDMETGEGGTISCEWREKVMKEGVYDYPLITSLLEKNEKETLTLEEAACVAGLIFDHILLGYSDGTAWFFQMREDGFWDLIRSDSGEYEVYMEELGYPELYAMVAAGRYLLMDYKGELTVINLDKMQGKQYSLSRTDREGTENVLAFTYQCVDDTVNLYQFGESVCEFIRMTDQATAGSDIQSFVYREDEEEIPYGIAVTQDENTTLWMKSDQGYHWYQIDY